MKEWSTGYKSNWLKKKLVQIELVENQTSMIRTSEN